MYKVYTGLQALSAWAACTGYQKGFLCFKKFLGPWAHQAFGRRPFDKYANKTQTAQTSADLIPTKATSLASPACARCIFSTWCGLLPGFEHSLTARIMSTVD